MALKDGKLRGFAVLAPWWVPPTDTPDADRLVSPGPGSSVAETTNARALPQVVGAQTQPIRFLGSRAGGNPGITDGSGAFAWHLGDNNSGKWGANDDADHCRHHIPPIRVTGAALRDVVASQDFRRDAVAFPLSGKIMVSSAIGTGSADVFELYNPHTHQWTEIPRPVQPTTPATLTVDEMGLAVIPGTETVIAVTPRGLAYKSDDYGQTWNLYSWFQDVADPTETWLPQDVRVAFDGVGNALMTFKRDNASTVHGVFSTNLGASWTEFFGTLTAAKYDIATHPGGSIVAVWIDGAGDLNASRHGGATTSFGGVTTQEISGDTFDDFCMGVDDDGVVWVIAHESGDVNHWRVYYSMDAGASWEDGSVIDQGVFTDGSATDPRVYYPKLVFANGRGCMITGVDATNDTFNSVAVWLGGWEGPCFDHLWEDDTSGDGSNVPTRERFRRFYFDDRYATQKVWVAGCTPANYTIPTTWAHTTVSAGTVALDIAIEPYGLLCETLGTGDAAYFSDAVNMNSSDEHYWEAEVAVPTTHDRDDANGAGILVHTPNYSYAIELNSAGFDIYDVEGATIAASYSFLTDSTSNIVRLRVSMDSSGNLTVLYNTIDQGSEPYTTRFEKKTETGLTSKGIATSASITAGVGMRANTVGMETVQLLFTYLSIVANYAASTSATAPVLCEGAENGWGKFVGADYAYPIPDAYDTANELVSRYKVRGGAILSGDSHHVEARSAFPRENVYPTVSPSPAQTHRVQKVAASTYTITSDYPVDAANSDLAFLPGQLWALLVCVRNMNARYLEVWGKRVTAGNTQLGTVDLATGFTGLDFNRGNADSAMLIPAGSTSSGARYVRAGELVGGHAVLDPSGTPVTRRILGNSAGWWNNATIGTVQQLTIELDAIDGSEPVTGDCDIVWPAGIMPVFLTPNAANLLEEVFFRVNSSGYNTAEDYYEWGEVGVYTLVIPGKQWGHGWEESLAPNVRVVENDYGSQWRTQRGPNVRTWTLNWDHGARDDAIDGQTTGDYLGVSGNALGTDQDVQGQVEWLWYLSKGGALPVVALMDIPADGVTQTDPRLFLPGYLEGSSRLQEAAGRSGRGVDSFYRVGPLNIVERV